QFAFARREPRPAEVYPEPASRAPTEIPVAFRLGFPAESGNDVKRLGRGRPRGIQDRQRLRQRLSGDVGGVCSDRWREVIAKARRRDGRVVYLAVLCVV